MRVHVGHTTPSGLRAGNDLSTVKPVLCFEVSVVKVAVNQWPGYRSHSRHTGSHLDSVHNRETGTWIQNVMKAKQMALSCYYLVFSVDADSLSICTQSNAITMNYEV